MRTAYAGTGSRAERVLLAVPDMKRRKADDFEEILAAFGKRPDGEERPKSQNAEPAEETGAPPRRRKNPVRRLLGSLSFPWPGAGAGLIGGLAWGRAAAYAEEAAEAQRTSQASAEAEVKPALLPVKSENEAIADELGLEPGLAIVDLKRIRRDFAKKNHPDRFEAARRPLAERRMSIANMLIDEQMRNRRQR